MERSQLSSDFKSGRALPVLSQRLAIFSVWGTLVGIVFFAVYPTTNWFTSLRQGHYEFFLKNELEVPFVPQLIWAYISMYALFTLPPFFLQPEQLTRLAKELIISTLIAGLVFMLLPARLGFLRVLPEEGFYRAIFQNLFSIDQPFNLVPSLHVVYSTAISLAVMVRASVQMRALLSLWLVLIVASTVLVHQHHFLDVISGILLAMLTSAYMERRNA